MNEYEIEFKGVTIFIKADNEMEASKKFTEQVQVGDWDSFHVNLGNESFMFFGNEFKDNK